MRRVRCFAMLSMTVILASCSVKEDRSDCPCWLTVRADETASLSAWYGSYRILEDRKGGMEDYTVPRGIVELVASEGRFTVPEGEQMDSLFAQRVQLNTNAEFATHTVRLNKNFTTVTVELKDTDDGRAGYELIVDGSVNGVDLRTLAPTPGPFHFKAEAAPEKGFRFRVPRQKDDFLQADLCSEGAIVETIPVGELIAKTGFDWNKEDLGDVHILADLPAHSFTITVMEWEGPVTFNITI